MRVYVGGLSQGTTEGDLSDRLSKYGNIGGIEMPSAIIGGHRGFAFVNIEFTSDVEQKRLFCLSGSVWKGGKLRIESVKNAEYKSDTHSHCEEEKPPRRRNLIRYADRDQKPPNEKNLDNKRRDWWYRGKYGRPVAIVRMRRPDGTLITVDPAHYKDRFEKLFGSEKPKQLSQLCWNVKEQDSTVISDQEEAECSEQHDSSSEDKEPVVDNQKSLRQPSNVAIPWAQLCETSKTSDFKFIKEPSKPDIIKRSAKVESTERDKISRFKNLFYDLSLLKPLHLFYKNRPLEELRREWFNQRPELRQDFKRRMKQAKRLIRKRQKLL